MDIRTDNPFRLMKSGFVEIYLSFKEDFSSDGFGGKSITFSQIAAEIIRDEATGKKNKDAQLFSFERAR